MEWTIAWSRSVRAARGAAWCCGTGDSKSGDASGPESLRCTPRDSSFAHAARGRATAIVWQQRHAGRGFTHPPGARRRGAHTTLHSKCRRKATPSRSQGERGYGRPSAAPASRACCEHSRPSHGAPPARRHTVLVVVRVACTVGRGKPMGGGVGSRVPGCRSINLASRRVHTPLPTAAVGRWGPTTVHEGAA